MGAVTASGGESAERHAAGPDCNIASAPARNLWGDGVAEHEARVGLGDADEALQHAHRRARTAPVHRLPRPTGPVSPGGGRKGAGSMKISGLSKHQYAGGGTA
jgi:hypothetical protein